MDGPRADAALDAPAPDLDAGISYDRVDLPSPDAWAVPGNWITLSSGPFIMGSPPNETCRVDASLGGKTGQETEHKVTLTRDFAISTTEVTQRQFKAVMGYNKSHHSYADHPVENLTWIEAVAYCTRHSIEKKLAPCYALVTTKTQCTMFSGCSESSEFCDQRTNTCASYKERPAYSKENIYTCPGYRLPTEAEWEYAYRAGTTGALYTYGVLDPKACSSCTVSSPAADAIAWHWCNAPKKHHAVKDKPANLWGLYDMAGNVSEWCHDRFVHDLGSDSVTNPFGAAIGDYRVVRGGDVSQWPGRVRAAARDAVFITGSGYFVGFRCVRSIISP